MVTFSFRAIDIGFDLRTTATPILRPTQIGWPNQYIRVEYTHLDGSPAEIEGNASICGSKLRKAGYTVDASWFAGRSNWGQPINVAGEDHRVFAAVGRAVDCERRCEAAGHPIPADVTGRDGVRSYLAGRGVDAEQIESLTS